MLLLPFAKLPCAMQNDRVLMYYNQLKHKQAQLFFKRLSDIIIAMLLLILLALPMAVIAIMIKAGDNGEILFRQRRVTQNLRVFTIYKFRTMRPAQSNKTRITTFNDNRITALGKFLRRCHLDEIPQLINILKGDMSFVGPRPELECFVAGFDNTMLATLLLPAGLTSATSLLFCNETKYLDSDDNERVYKELLLPRKMAVNVKYIENFSLKEDIRVCFDTIKYFLKADIDEFED